MKLHTTRKAIVQNSPRIVSVGYCSLCYLLSCIEPFAYTTGIYGWNFDAYEVDGLTICTGYRNMPGRTANHIKEYEERAKELRYEHDEQVSSADCKTYADYERIHEEYRQKTLALLREFAAQA